MLGKHLGDAPADMSGRRVPLEVASGDIEDGVELRERRGSSAFVRLLREDGAHLVAGELVGGEDAERGKVALHRVLQVLADRLHRAALLESATSFAEIKTLT